MLIGTLTSSIKKMNVGRVPNASSKAKPSKTVPRMTSRIKHPICPTTPATSP